MPDDETLRFIHETPLTFGPWRTFKGLYKRLEADPSADPAVLGALIARLDSIPFAQEQEALSVNLGQVHRLGSLAARDELLAMSYLRNLAIFDFSGPDKLHPKRVASTKREVDQRANDEQLLWCGPLLVLRENANVHIYELERQELKRLASLSLGAIHVAASFPYLFVVVKDGLRIVDLRNVHGPGAGVEVRGASQVAAGDGFAVVLSGPTRLSWNRLPGRGGVSVVDVSDISRPKVIGDVSITDGQALALKGRRACVLAGPQYGEHRLHVLDLATLHRPQIVGNVALGYGYEGAWVLVHGDSVYASMGHGVTAVIDVREPARPRKVRTMPGGIGQSALAGEWLYGAMGRELRLWNVAHPMRPMRYGAPPSPQTFGYLKRRARRTLKALALQNPEQFVAVASPVLLAAPETLDPTTHWVALDLLFGAGGRYVQRRHGRGALVETRPRTLSIRRREERGAAAWDAHPARAASLLASGCWPAMEIGVKALRAAGVPCPPLGDDALGRALSSPSLVLLAEAARQCVGREKLPADCAARAFAVAVARVRRQLVPAILRQAAADPAWKVAFAEALLQTTRSTGRRFSATAALMATHFPECVGGVAILRLVPGLMASGDERLRQMALDAARTVDEGTAEDWLRLLPTLSPAHREAVLSALETGVGGKDLGEPDVLSSSDPIVIDGLWRLLAASATPAPTLKALWEEVFLAPEASALLQGAMASPAALAVLGRAGFSADELTKTLTNRPALVGFLTAATFAALTRTLPAATTLRLIAAADDGAWERLQEGWRRNLPEGFGIDALWAALPEALTTDPTGRIEARVLANAAIGEALLGADDAAALLALREPALGPLLGRWLLRRWPTVEAEEGLLLAAATHPLADVRTPALELVARRPLRLPFALRLLECELPACVAAGKRWFEETDAIDLSVRALALADSPVASVRAYGREFLRARPELLDASLLALMEHDAPEMLAFVAEQAGMRATPDFDRAILRTRHRSRRAKEAVKSRDAQVDTETLLTLARGAGTPRDAEWALGQLARRALAGEKIDGLEVE